MVKKITALVLSAALACLVASCAADSPDIPNSAESAAPTRSEAPQLPAATPTAAPKSSAQVLAETKEELERAIRDNLRFDVEGLLPPGEGEDRLDINLSNDSSSRWMLAIRDEVSGAIAEAVEKAESGLAVGPDVQFVNQIAAPDWQYLYMLLRLARTDTAQYGGSIAASLSVETSALCDCGQTSITVRVAPMDYRDAILLNAGGDKAAYLSADFAYTYMMTVFDENIAEKEYVQPPAQGNLAAGIAWPLERYTRLRKTWYAARDGGSRKHTGTDIWAREGTEIYSCTGGTVFYVGASAGGGNSVLVVDDYGYMFYYLHMVRLTDFLEEGQRVEAGQLIGHVGNTGNSSRDHLHLTIAGPDGILINPYPYLADAMPD